MTSELEEQFYKTFDIEKQYRTFEDDYGKYQTHEKLYPDITAEKLLEMICVLSQWDEDNCYQILTNNVQDLKNEILNDCLIFKQKLKNKYFDVQIQQLFKDQQ
ncbi:MAG: hypothetical protein IJH34_08265 [Romboutsia sp.]|nr:hypothetical protein [Romboutsia sp.]